MTSQVTSDLRFEISNLNCPGTYVHVASNSSHASLACKGFLEMIDTDQISFVDERCTLVKTVL